MDRPTVTMQQMTPAEVPLGERAEHLERGGILTFPASPVSPDGEGRSFLFAQRLQPGQLALNFDPQGRLVAKESSKDLVRGILERSAGQAERWMASVLPQYATTMKLDHVAFHPEEEATRKLRPTGRNDLLHVDAPPQGATCGQRLLRLFVNLHPTDPRVWLTSLPFGELLSRFGHEVGLPTMPTKTWWEPLRTGVLRLLQTGRDSGSPYDDFVSRLHDFLKQHDGFQERAPKKCWRFPPGAAWLAFTDGVSHAELRGRYILDHAFLISHDSLACPNIAPRTLFARACGMDETRRAA